MSIRWRSVLYFRSLTPSLVEACVCSLGPVFSGHSVREFRMHPAWRVLTNTCAGEQHRRQRKMLNPVFSTKHLRETMPIFYTVIHKVSTGRYPSSTLNGD